METWRIIATCLMAFGGIVMTLLITGKVRDDRNRNAGDVARAALWSSLVFAVLCLLIATVLPGTVVWGVVAAQYMILILMHHIG
ncbi:hypothetical protein [Kutzneria kofuensis]|uniref:Uncharacterized protein n=1 Tax=Kutzneria kofuensis TaxID=103725 RepID=A0A7W9KGW3_9PSEU|nr:hypothetical protein [Kutzneria kofuensis]MBB5892367.1 hypothetical protein [Kutzneria kofuensis]